MRRSVFSSALGTMSLMALTVACASAPAATISTATAVDSDGKATGATEITYAGEPNEANRLTVGRIESRNAPATADGGSAVVPVQTLTFHDDGALITAGKGCVTDDARTATCAASRLSRPVIVVGSAAGVVTSAADAIVIGGKGNDRFDASTAPAFSASGGLGADQMIGSAGDDNLTGGPGADTLIGNGGNDLLSGDGGRDRFQCGSGGRQTASLDGFDTLLPPLPGDPTAGRSATARFDTDCETLFFNTPQAIVDIAIGTVRLRRGELVFTNRLNQRLDGTFAVRSDDGRTLARGAIRASPVRLRLTAAGRAQLTPGSTQPVRLIVYGGRGPIPAKLGPGARVGLSIGPR
jgi:hypothetical protein